MGRVHLLLLYAIRRRSPALSARHQLRISPLLGSHTLLVAIGDVLYNPANSNDAFVRGGERVAAYILGIGGVVFTIVGLLMALAALDRALP